MMPVQTALRMLSDSETDFKRVSPDGAAQRSPRLVRETRARPGADGGSGLTGPGVSRFEHHVDSDVTCHSHGGHQLLSRVCASAPALEAAGAAIHAAAPG